MPGPLFFFDSLRLVDPNDSYRFPGKFERRAEIDDHTPHHRPKTFGSLGCPRQLRRVYQRGYGAHGGRNTRINGDMLRGSVQVDQF